MCAIYEDGLDTLRSLDWILIPRNIPRVSATPFLLSTLRLFQFIPFTYLRFTPLYIYFFFSSAREGSRSSVYVSTLLKVSVEQGEIHEKSFYIPLEIHKHKARDGMTKSCCDGLGSKQTKSVTVALHNKTRFAHYQAVLYEARSSTKKFLCNVKTVWKVPTGLSRYQKL